MSKRLIIESTSDNSLLSLSMPNPPLFLLHSIGSLLIYGGVYWFLAAVTYGAFIPSGLFTPSLILGGCLGRSFAEILHLIGVPRVEVSVDRDEDEEERGKRRRFEGREGEKGG